MQSYPTAVLDPVNNERDIINNALCFIHDIAVFSFARHNAPYPLCLANWQCVFFSISYTTTVGFSYNYYNFEN